MRLRHLTINALPGISPGFTFEPPGTGIVLVVGPNAIGKSSLPRALKHLLAPDQKTDPPALSLEAAFDSDDAAWRVSRNGSQIQWLRNGEATTAPSLPSSDQFNLYRLSMESLLLEDPGDQALAEEIWRALRGGFDLDAPRIDLGSRWGRKEEAAVSKALRQLRAVKGRYTALRNDEAKLASLDDEIQAARQAAERLKQLELAMELHEAIDRRQALQEAANQYPPDMDKLKGNELKRLDDSEATLQDLRTRAQDEQIKRQAAVAQLQASGLADSAPEAEAVDRIEAHLSALDNHVSARAHAAKDANEAAAALKVAQAQFQGGGEAPNLSPNTLEQARKIVEPLVDGQYRLRDLQQQLKLAGEPPEDAEIEQLRTGVHALRTWLAAIAHAEPPDQGTTGTLWFTATALFAVAAVMAFIEQAWSGLAAIAVAGLGLLLALVQQTKRNAQGASQANDARKAFIDTELEPPKAWTSAVVGEHLRRAVEPRLNELTLQRERASGAAMLRVRIEEAQSEVETLNAAKAELAEAIGFDPDLAGPTFYRLAEVASNWNLAHQNSEARQSALLQLDSEIAAETAAVRRFLDQWRTADAPPLDATGTNAAAKELRIALNHLKGRLDAAKDAQARIKACEQESRSLERQIKQVEKDVQTLFAETALEPDQRTELEGRIARLGPWQQAIEQLKDAQRDESNLRSRLAEGLAERLANRPADQLADPLDERTDLIEAVESGQLEWLQAELERTRSMAGTYTDLVKERQSIETQLNEAGKQHDLEQAAGELDAATAALEDKREAALRSQATQTLLGDIESQFRSEHEPDLLRRAKTRFEQVTAHEFSLELHNTKHFAARDLKQGQLRNLEELSSGTRMQLLLALRLAWTEAQEQGGETLPLFLDEALTTSDENRFAVMANTLTRLAEAGDRQIFYLSARRLESALWERATGTRPPVIDLAEVRFGTKHLQPKDFEVETPPPPPPPAVHDAASYAALLGVPHFDPILEPGGMHLFHLLRDDLPMLHRLMATWRITTLGQLEHLLTSNAAEGALPDAAARKRLKQRCNATRAWVDLWRQGRGRPVNRAVLERSGAVSANFIDRAAELADELQGDGTALINALRQGRLRRFLTTKTNELEHWLADKGYTDDQNGLSADERRRLTLTATAPQTEDATNVNRLMDWLEAAATRHAPQPRLSRSGQTQK